MKKKIRSVPTALRRFPKLPPAFRIRPPFFFSALLIALFLPACTERYEHPLYEESPDNTAPYTTFAEYINNTRAMLEQNRHFITAHHAREIDANMPHEYLPPAIAAGTAAPQKGVLLIHGLGDSPWSFADIAPHLAKHGFVVRTILLNGHGTRPANMIHATHSEWHNLVAKQIALFKKDVPELYLGGFSTGANLALLHAIDDKEIKGLMLFSPAFKPQFPSLFLAEYVAKLRHWLVQENPVHVTNYTRYPATPTYGFAQYYNTSREVLAVLKRKSFTRPVFIAQSEDDSVLDAHAIKTLFCERFPNPKNKFMWFTTKPDTPNSPDSRITSFNSFLPQKRISNMSHMGITFSPRNPYYGANGIERICNNGQGDEGEALCRAGAPVWYSAWGHKEDGKLHARLTYNPYFDEMMQELLRVFE